MNTDPYMKETDNCPVQPGWEHVAGVPIRRACIEPLDLDSLPGLDDLMATMLRSRGPWNNIDSVNHFLTLHGLSFGDVVDFVDGGGNIECRFDVLLEGLNLMWASERRSVWFVRDTFGAAEMTRCGHCGVVPRHEEPLQTDSRSPVLPFDERLRLAFEALRSAESMANAIHEHRQPDDSEGVPNELVEPILSTIGALEDAIAIRPQGTWPLSYLDLAAAANKVRRRDCFTASTHLNGTLMGYLDNSLYSGMSVDEYTLALQILFWGTRLLAIVGMDWDFGLPEQEFRWAGELWFQYYPEAKVLPQAFLNNIFARRLDPCVYSLLTRALATNQIVDWTQLRIAIDVRLNYSRSCGDAIRQLLLLWAIDNNVVGTEAHVYH